MSLSRDRLARPIDISALIPHTARSVGLIVAEPGLHRGLGSPSRNVPGSSGVGRVPASEALTLGPERGSITRRSQIGQGSGRRRTLRRGRGASLSGSGVHSWYPRTPLRDVTAAARVTERRAQDNENATDGVENEHDLSFKTPLPASFSKKLQRSPVSRAWSIVTSIARDKSDAFMTPEKKLLGSIEKVRKVLMEDQHRMQNTPAAKKAERERRMRTLMSMR